MNRLIHNKKTTPLFVAAIVLACFTLLPQARAVCKNDCLAGQNTVHGDDALFSLTVGIDNTANGYQALYSNTFGTGNTAIGDQALYSNIEGGGNTATAYSALYSNTSGVGNTGTGGQALYGNTTGNLNTADGYGALAGNTTGSSNIALGTSAGSNLTTGDNNIDIGNEGVAGESNTIRIGTQGTQTATYIAGINRISIGKGLVVEVDASGHLGTRGSSRRFKDQIKPMDKASEAILALKPVTFRYKKEVDPDGTPQFGLVAEDVAKVNPDLILRDKEGKPYAVRYDQVNAMLLNEFLKEHRKIDQLEKQIAALTAGLEKVSAQLATRRVRVAAATALEASKFALGRIRRVGPAPQTVLNN